jgi:autotransporter-associated beta strand protein
MSTRSRFAVSLCLALLLIQSARPISAASSLGFTNGNFENDFPPWQPLDIGCWGNGVHYKIWSDPSQVGSTYAQLGTNDSAGGIFQSFSTVANVTYGISFWGSGDEGRAVNTGYFSVSGGSFNGVVTDAGQNIHWSLIPSDLLSAAQFVADRNAANNFFGWNTYSGYQFTASSGTSTITFWNDIGNSARVDNVVITPISGPLASSAGNGDWNAPTTWSTASVPGPSSVVISGKSVTVNPAVSASAASCVSLSLTGSGSLRVYGGQSLTVEGPASADAGSLLKVDSGASLLISSASTSRLGGLSAAAGATINAASQLVVDSNVNLTGVTLAFGPSAPLVLASNTLTKTDGLNVASLRATGGGLNLAAGSLVVTGTLEIDNSAFTVSNAVAPQVLTLVNASLSGAGSVRPTSQYRFSSIAASNPTSSLVCSGSGTQMSIGDDGKGGTVVLAASNTYAGPTLVQGGALQAADGLGLPTASNLVLNGGVMESHGTFTRSLGVSAGQVDWYAGGFSAQGGKLLVTLGDPAGGPYTPLVWASYGTPSFVRENMVFGSLTADSEVELPHAIDLNGAAHEIKVIDNIASTTDCATLSGALTDGSISKSGKGKLVLSNSANSLSAVTVNDGLLSLASAGALGSSGSITFGGGTLQFTASNTVDYSNRIQGSTAPISLDTNGGTVTLVGGMDDSNIGGLNKLGAGTLVLSGSNAYAGGTTVSQGTLILTNPAAVLNRSDLIVGSATSLFSTAPVPNTVPADAAIPAVPEPGTFALLFFAGAICGLAWNVTRVKRRSLRDASVPGLAPR